MRLISIQLRDFRAHEDTRVDFPGSGVISFTGSNEAGKSTIAVEALLFALFGAPAIRGKLDGVKFKGAPAKRRPEVELVLELDGERIRIVRTDKNAKVFAGEADIPVAAGTSPSNGYLRQRLGLSLEEFSAAFVAQQRDLARIAGMGPVERQQFIREVIGISRIDRALKSLRRRKNELASEREGLAVGLGERSPLLEERDSAAAAVASASDACHTASVAIGAATAEAWQASEALATSTARKDAHDAAARRLDTAQADCRSARIEIDRLNVELTDAHAARAALAAEQVELQKIPGLRTERDRLLAAKAAASERTTLEHSAQMAQHDVQQYGDYVKDCDRVIAEYDQQVFAAFKEEYRAAQERFSRMIADRTRQHAELNAAADAASKREEKIAQQIRTLYAHGADGQCPLCLGDLTDRFETVIETLGDEANLLCSEATDLRDSAAALADPSDDELALDAELEDLKQKGERYRQAEKDCTAAKEQKPSWARQLQIAKSRVAECAAKLTALPNAVYIPEALVQVNDEITRLEAIDRGLADVRGRASRIDLLLEQRSAAEQRATDAEAHVKQAEEAIAAAEFDLQHHTVVTAAAKVTEQALAAARQEEARATEQLRGAEAALRKAEQALAAYDTRAGQLDALTQTVQVHEAAAERLDAFRVAAAATLRPEMEEYMSGFISVLTDGRHESVTIGDDFSVICQESGVDMEVISGGAEDVVALAQRVALSQMIAERRGRPLSLLVLDEPFGALDAERRPAVLDFLRRLSATFSQVVVISHVDESKYAADHVIQVEHDAARGCSRVLMPDIAGESRQESAISGERRQSPAGAAA